MTAAVQQPTAIAPADDYKSHARVYVGLSQRNADQIARFQAALTAEAVANTYLPSELRAMWSSYRDAWRKGDGFAPSAAACMVAIECAVEASKQAERARRTLPPRRRTTEAELPRVVQQTRAEIVAQIKTIPAGRYAVEIDGALGFYKVEVPDKGRWAGFRFVVAESGGNHRRIDRDTQTRVLLAIAADPTEALSRYGIETVRCGACMTKLTRSLSRLSGIGPDCAKARNIDRKPIALANGWNGVDD